MAPFTPDINSVADYFGLPITGKALSGISALPFRSHNIIFNDWFRDENLQPSIAVSAIILKLLFRTYTVYSTTQYLLIYRALRNILLLPWHSIIFQMLL
jgi:hypothetical protein